MYQSKHKTNITETINLQNVTILSIDGRRQIFATEMAHKALQYSIRHINFGAAKLLTPSAPINLSKDIDHIEISPIESHRDYSKFVFHDLYQHVSTPFCLLIQADGFVTNPSAWLPEFFHYDYIGAPWPDTTAQRLGADYTIFDLSQNARVGNGGFCIRSRKLLELCTKIDYELFSSFPEDFVICRLLREYLSVRGITFAPLDIAAKFALELPIKEAEFDLTKTFGFHGRHFEPERLLMAFEPIDFDSAVEPRLD